jgi:hypothetical protein
MRCVLLAWLALSCVVLACLVLSCLFLSCLLLFCRIVSCLAFSSLAFSTLVFPCLVLFCRVLSCLVSPYLGLSCLVLSCVDLSCVVSCLVLFCLVLSCLVRFYIVVIPCAVLSGVISWCLRLSYFFVFSHLDFFSPRLALTCLVFDLPCLTFSCAVLCVVWSCQCRDMFRYRMSRSFRWHRKSRLLSTWSATTQTTSTSLSHSGSTGDG